jgi:hypothetical protein
MGFVMSEQKEEYARAKFSRSRGEEKIICTL